MKSEKRGQVTIFVIIGLVIVGGLISFFVYQGKADDRYFSQQGVSEGVDAIQDYLVECITFSSESSLTTVMAQGGYYDKPSYVEEYADEQDSAFIPYYYYEGEVSMPSIETIEAEIGKAVDAEAAACVDNAAFTDFDISYARLASEVEILDDEVVVTVDMPVKLEREGHVMTLEMNKYPVHMPSLLKGIHNVAQYFVQDVSQSGDATYCLNCLGDLAVANGVFIDVIARDETSSAIILSESVGIEENDYTYYFFLAKYTEEEADRDFFYPLG